MTVTKQPVQERLLLSRKTSPEHPAKDGGGGDGDGICAVPVNYEMHQTVLYVGSAYMTGPGGR